MKKTYLVGVERPLYDSQTIIKVTDSMEGFSADLLGVYPVEEIDAIDIGPQQVGWLYAVAHDWLPIRIIVNTAEESSEWEATPRRITKIEED